MLLMLSLVMAVSCDNVIDDPFVKDKQEMSLPEIARMMAELPLGEEQLREVHGAVVSSSEHGYDEEYTMRDIFLSPGAGVGASEEETRAGGGYDQPLRSLIESWLGERLRSRAGDSGIDTRSSSGGFDGILGISTKASATVEDYITALTESDAQIYWPYSTSWDGETMPVITYDPLSDTDTNVGYVLTESGLLEEIVVTEEMASERPVWVINRNDDSAYESLEMLRRRDPSWGQGGSIVVRSGSNEGSGEVKTLILKDFTMHRNYDCWFAGASEFFVKCGAVEDFKATTESELLLYSPNITDFMIVVRRDQVGQKLPFNAVLVSDWTDQLENFAFMITEDDGGTRTTWKTNAEVKVKSKTYGINLEIPYNTRDDIVWRGKLSSRYFTKNADVQGHFGDVSLTFSFE